MGHKQVVHILHVLGEGDLLRLGCVLGDRPSDQHEARELLSAVQLVTELPCPPAVLDMREPNGLCSGLDDGILFGHDDIPATLPLEELDGPIAEEARIHQEVEPAPNDRRGNLG